MRLAYVFAAALVALTVAGGLLPRSVFAHSAGSLDGHGCHYDRRVGNFHCHRGEYSSLKFRSKAEMLDYKKRGVPAYDIRGEREGLSSVDPSTPISPEPDEGWRTWLPFRRHQGAETARADVIVPRGIQERLRALKGLHEEGLITDEDYEAKRKQILGEL